MFDALTLVELKELDRKLHGAFLKADSVWTDYGSAHQNAFVMEIARVGYEVSQALHGI